MTIILLNYSLMLEFVSLFGMGAVDPIILCHTLHDVIMLP